jgi:hypothetical protein
LFRIACLLFVTTFDSRLLISIALHCIFAIICTFVDYYISTCTSVDSCIFASTMFSSLASFCIAYVSTTSSSSYSNEHWIYWCSSLSYLFSCTPTFFTSAPKLNCRCSSHIYIMNYHLCKLYLLIICLPFCTFWRWWMWQQLYNQWLNIQHALMFCSFQLL